MSIIQVDKNLDNSANTKRLDKRAIVAIEATCSERE